MAEPKRARRSLPAIAELQAIAAESFGGEIVPAPIPLGHSETGDPIGIDIDKLLDGRLLIQGMSGAGKSWLLRRLLETTADRLQQIVLDPEGEFGSLAERYGHVTLDADRLDPTALKHAAARAREHRLSLHIDLSQVERDRQLAAVAAILSTLVMAPADHWHPCLVAVDEVHLFAPQGGSQGAAPHLRRASLDAVSDLMSRGRKRGLCGVLATQRLVKLAKSVASEAGNVLVGRNVLELDISRAAEAIGWPDRKAQDRLPNLLAGTFVAVGPAFTKSPVVIGIGPVQTRHRGSTPRIGAPPPRCANAAEVIELDELHSASEVRALAQHSGINARDVDAIRRFASERGAAAALRILEDLRLIAPLPRLVAQLGPMLAIGAGTVDDGLSLLEDYGLVQFDVAASGRTVRAA